jgi:hypothetical protein
MFSRRDFFSRFTRVVENPQKWREKRVAELKAIALDAAPLDWSDDQREETTRAVERKLSYLSDITLRQENMRKYVEDVVRTTEIRFAAQRAEEEFLRRQQADSNSNYDTYPYEENP